LLVGSSNASGGNAKRWPAWACASRQVTHAIGSLRVLKSRRAPASIGFFATEGARGEPIGISLTAKLIVARRSRNNRLRQGLTGSEARLGFELDGELTKSNVQDLHRSYRGTSTLGDFKHHFP
jgi:hypothetical protein